MKNINLISCLQSVLDWCPYIALGRLGGRTNRARRLAIPSQAGPEQIYSHNLRSGKRSHNMLEKYIGGHQISISMPSQANSEHIYSDNVGRDGYLGEGGYQYE